MAYGIKVEGLKELQRDLKAIDRDLPRQLNQELRKIAEPWRAESARLAPRSTIDRTRRRNVTVDVRGTRGVQTTKQARVPHVSDTLKVGVRGSTLSIYSTRSGAGVIHWGGRHPLFGDRDHWYAQRASPFITRAAPKYLDQLERDIGDTVERLWNGLGR